MRMILRVLPLLFLGFLLSSCVSQREHLARVQSLETEIKDLESNQLVTQKQQQKEIKRSQDSVRIYKTFLSMLRQEKILVGADSLNLSKLLQTRWVL